MGTKARIALLVLFLFGVPAVVVSTLLTVNSKDLVADGAQRGGVLTGTVHDLDGANLADIEIEVTSVTANGARARIADAKSDAQGSFAITLPPCQGHYEVRASGAEWQDQRLELSWLDVAGNATTSPPMRITLLQAARVDIDFVHSNGSAAGAGTFELSGIETSGFFGSFGTRRTQISGAFEGGKLSILGLPPMQAHVLVRLASGERAELVLQLVAGKNQHRVEL